VKKTDGKNPQPEVKLSKLKALSERFLSQTNAENARDPELRRAQSLVAQTISIARAKYSDDPVNVSKEVEARRQEIALRIAKGDKIAVIQVCGTSRLKECATSLRNRRCSVIADPARPLNMLPGKIDCSLQIKINGFNLQG
jgi:hypothetical protein